MKNPYDRLSRAISYALHPLIVPTIAALLLLFGPTVMSNLPAEARWFIAAVVLLNTLILPAFSLAVLKLFGGLSDLRLQSQRQRMLPMGYRSRLLYAVHSVVSANDGSLFWSTGF